MPQKPVFDVLGLERLSQQRVVLQVNHPPRPGSWLCASRRPADATSSLGVVTGIGPLWCGGGQWSGVQRSTERHITVGRWQCCQPAFSGCWTVAIAAEAARATALPGLPTAQASNHAFLISRHNDDFNVSQPVQGLLEFFLRLPVVLADPPVRASILRRLAAMAPIGSGGDGTRPGPDPL